MPVVMQIRDRRELEGELQRLGNVLSDQRGVWQPVIDNALRPRIRQSFVSNGFGRWARRVDNLPHPLLRKSLRLYRSLVQEGAEGNIDIRSEHSLIFGTDIEYADAHEFGTGRIPARPYLSTAVERGLDGKVAREIDMWFQEQFNRGRR